MSEHVSFHLDSTYNFNKKSASWWSNTYLLHDWLTLNIFQETAGTALWKRMTHQFSLCVMLLYSFNISIFIIFKERSRRTSKTFKLVCLNECPALRSCSCMLDHYCSKYWPDSVCWVGLPTAMNVINKTFELLDLSVMSSSLASCLTGSDRDSRIPLGLSF